MIIDLGFSLDCSSFACSEVLSSKSLDGGNETAVQMHMVLPWGVPLPVAQTLAIDVGLGGKALVDGLGLPHRNGQTVTQVYGNAVAGLITAVQVCCLEHYCAQVGLLGEDVPSGSTEAALDDTDNQTLLLLASAVHRCP